MTNLLQIVGVVTLVFIDSTWSFNIPSLQSESITHVTRCAILLQQRRIATQLPAHHVVFDSSLSAIFIGDGMISNSAFQFVPTSNVAVVSASSSDMVSSLTQTQSVAFSLPFMFVWVDESLDAIRHSTGFIFNVGDVFGTAQNVAIGITAVLLALAGLYFYWVVTIMIPAGVKILENECQVLIPDTWDEYMNKLKDGETIQDRPDLLEDLWLLLGKAKENRLEMMCRQTNSTELWDKYQAKLANGEQLHERPELMKQFLDEATEVLATKARAKCTPELWAKYEAQLGPNETMNMRQDLVVQLVQEIKGLKRGQEGDPTPTSTTSAPSSPTINSNDE